MIKKKGFILMEMVVTIFLVAIISLSISGLIYNNNKNMIFLENTMTLDEILNNEAYRAKAGLKPNTYNDYTVSYYADTVFNSLGTVDINIEYIEVTVRSMKYSMEKSLTIVRRADN